MQNSTDDNTFKDLETAINLGGLQSLDIFKNISELSNGTLTNAMKERKKAGRKRKVDPESSYTEYSNDSIRIFLRCVEDYEALWNANSSLYCRKDVRAQCYRNLEEKCEFLKKKGAKGNTARRLWTELHEEYMNECKRLKPGGCSSEEIEVSAEFPYYHVIDSFVPRTFDKLSDIVAGLPDNQEESTEWLPEYDEKPTKEDLLNTPSVSLSSTMATIGALSKLDKPRSVSNYRHDDLHAFVENYLNQLPIQKQFEAKIKIFAFIECEKTALSSQTADVSANSTPLSVD